MSTANMCPSDWILRFSALDLYGGTPSTPSPPSPSSPPSPPAPPAPPASPASSPARASSSKRRRHTLPDPPPLIRRRRNNHHHSAPSSFNSVFRRAHRAARIEARARLDTQRRALDRQFGFVPLSRRHGREPDIEASKILGAALAEGRVTADGEMPRVWMEPDKAQLREIGRLGEAEGAERCCGLLSAPKMGARQGAVMWRALVRVFEAEEGARAALERARGKWCFTEVPAELLAGVEMRRRLDRRLGRKGNSEQDGQVVDGIMGVLRKPWGRVVGCMPVIEEERAGDGEAAEGGGKGTMVKGARRGN